MFRYKTLFSRILAVCMGILLIAILLLNVICATRLRKNAVEEVVLRLSEGCNLIYRTFQEYYETGNTDEQLFAYVKEMAEKRSGSIWIANAYDKIVIELNYDEDYEQYENYARQNQEMMAEKISSGDMVYTLYEGDGLYYAPVVTVGCAIRKDGTTIGSIYMNGQVAGIDAVISQIQQASMAVIGITLILAVFFSFEVSRKISKPLYDMNQAANELAKGNFDQRIEVTERGEIGQLTETFNMMAEALEKYEDTRSSFVGNVSHELKSPLTAIQGFIQGMLDGTISQEEQKGYLEIVLSEARRMNALIIDLLDLVRIESDQFPMDMTVWDINELIRRCIINFIGKIEDKHIDLSVNIPEERTEVRADMDRITQVITNLLDNAIKFCEEGGTIKIWTYLSDGKVNINISNTGQIIPPEDLKYIFDRFFKVDKSHNRKIPGTGIGLSIVKEIINRHDEKIWVNSQAGMGTVFTFTLALTNGKEKDKDGKRTEK